MMQGAALDKEFIDAGVSGAVLAASRPGFKALLEFLPVMVTPYGSMPLTV